ncbi:MAG: Hsp20/alpha crystallin family protein [Massilia sp.]|nr:Hsp20/alpha crystallin family protein [Massilia sp.]
MNLVRRTGSPLARYRPSAIEDQFGRMVESMFEDFFSPVTQAGALSGIATPSLDVTENEKSFQVQIEMPGVKKEDVKVAIDRQRVSIEAESRHEETQREGESVLYTERTARKFMRSFALPAEVDDAGAEARMEDGVLTLTLPKKLGSEGKRLTIN